MEAASRAPRLGDAAKLLSPIAQTDLGGDMTLGSNVSGTMDATGTTANLLGEHGDSAFLPDVTAPRDTQSPETHVLQQALRDSANAYVHNNGSAFSNVGNVGVHTVNEDGDSLDEGVGPTNLDAVLSNASNYCQTTSFHWKCHQYSLVGASVSIHTEWRVCSNSCGKICPMAR